MSEKRAVGRPSKYNEVLQAMADDYVINHEKLQGDVVPSVAGLCCYLGIVRSTAHEWTKVYPEFSNTARAIDVKQEMLTLNGALTGKLNAQIAKLLLSSNHGYSESNKIDHTTKGESIAPKIIERVIIDPKNADTNT